MGGQRVKRSMRATLEGPRLQPSHQIIRRRGWQEEESRTEGLVACTLTAGQNIRPQACPSTLARPAAVRLPTPAAPYLPTHPTLPPTHLVQSLPHVSLHPVFLLKLAADAPHERGSHHASCKAGGGGGGGGDGGGAGGRGGGGWSGRGRQRREARRLPPPSSYCCRCCCCGCRQRMRPPTSLAGHPAKVAML